MADEEDQFEVRWSWRISMPWSKVHVGSLDGRHPWSMMLHAGYMSRGDEIIDIDRHARAMAMIYWSGLNGGKE